MNACMPKNSIHFFKEISCGLCIRSAIKANNGVISNTNKMECVKPRWASRFSEVVVKKAATKSISGTLCAIAPKSMALLPNCLPANACPIQAPKAICVIESSYCYLQSNKVLVATNFV